MATKKTTKAAPKTEAPKKEPKVGDVSARPASFGPGAFVRFSSRPASGSGTYLIETAQGAWFGALTTTADDSSVNKIIEQPGVVTVSFFEDGTKYASGEFTA